MVKRLFIAEKASLGCEVAMVLGKQANDTEAVKLAKAILSKKDRSPFVTVGDDTVTWLRGHFFENDKPGSYGYRFADLNNMPVIVQGEWKMHLKEDQYGYFEKQARVIEDLIKQSDEIINLGDAGREGQLLVDEALIEWGVDAFSDRVKRLWIKSLTASGITSALDNIIPNSQKRLLYDAALARARGDWQHGMTFTGMFTGFARLAGAEKDVIISIGRVQTVMARIIHDREQEYKNFKAIDYFSPTVTFTHEKGTFEAKWVFPSDMDGCNADGLLVDRSVVDKMFEKVVGQDGVVTNYSSSVKSVSQPSLFDLSGLTIECSRRFNMTSERVLEIAQSLYQKKITSYPRTDSCYLSNSQKVDIPVIFKALSCIPQLATVIQGADEKTPSSCWNDAKVSDHYALIPESEFTEEKYRDMTSDERKVFHIIALRYLCQFYPPARYKALVASIECAGEKFKANGSVPVDDGWRVVNNAFKADQAEDAEADDSDDNVKGGLIEMTKGDNVHADKGAHNPDKTKRPQRLTDGTLEALLKAPHLLEKNIEIRKMLKEGDGIGRPSTRPPILKALIEERKFVKRDGKYLVMTPLGASLIETVPEELKSIGLTALWEGKIEEVNSGRVSLSEYLSQQVSDLKEKCAMFMEKYGKTGLMLKGMSVIKPLPGDGKECPECHKGIMKTTQIRSKKTGKTYTVLACRDGEEGCKHMEFPDDSAGLKPLPGDGKECPHCHQGVMKTRKIKSNKTGKEYIVLACKDGAADCKHLEFPDDSAGLKPLPGDGKECPHCHKGIMKTKKIKSKKTGKEYIVLACKDGAEDCNHMEFPDDSAGLKPLPGDGKECSHCHQGVMKTKKIKSKKTGKEYIVLACTGGAEGCKNMEFPDANDNLPKLPGDGDICDKCGKGHMKTVKINSKKTGKSYIALSCRGGEEGCNNVKFPSK